MGAPAIAAAPFWPWFCLGSFGSQEGPRRAPQVPGTPFPKDYVPCYDPGNLQLLGSGRMPAMTPAQVWAAALRPRFLASGRRLRP